MANLIFHPASKSKWIREIREDLFLGADWRKDFIWQTRASVGASAVDVDLTGYTVVAKYRQDSLEGSVEFTLTDTDGISITDTTGGGFEIHISDTRVDDLTVGKKGFLDLLWTDASGDKIIFPAVLTFDQYKTSSGQ